MKLSKEAKIILSICWKNGEPMSTNFVIGSTYTWKGEKFKPTESTYQELLEYQKYSDYQYEVIRSKQIVNVMGKSKRS